MRYGNPSIASALRALQLAGVGSVRVIPLFPHYAMSSYESAVERVKQVAAKLAPSLTLDVLPPYSIIPNTFARWPCRRARAANRVRSFPVQLSRRARAPRAQDRPTGSHCLQAPQCCERSSAVHATCYRHQCFVTAKLFAEAARLPAGKFSVAFQSRLGRDKWLGPAAQDEMVRLAREGVRKLVVICPAFTVDCLETLEEIGIRGRAAFVEAAGGN